MRWKRDRKKDKLPQISCSSFILADVGPQILVRTFYQSDTANNHLPERFNKICRSYEQSFELSIDRRVRTDAFTNFHISQPLYIAQKVIVSSTGKFPAIDVSRAIIWHKIWLQKRGTRNGWKITSLLSRYLFQLNFQVKHNGQVIEIRQCTRGVERNLIVEVDW